MAPKRRGRPPKPKQADDVVVQQGSAVPKRGRGRPPKVRIEGEAVSASTPKTKSNKSTTTKTAAKVAAKPRGRPRKSKAGTAKPPEKVSSVVGGYAITCKAISEEWPDQGDDFGLDISESHTPGIYEGSFDFGILEGAMFLSSDAALLGAYVKGLQADEDGGMREYLFNYGEEDLVESGEGEESDEPAVATGGKRKAANTTRGQPAKKVKKAPSPGLKFRILWRGRDTGEGQIHHVPEPGMIKFTNKTYTKFTGEISLPYVGSFVKITGEKVTNESSAGSYSSWKEYSEDAYESANTNRWH